MKDVYWVVRWGDGSEFISESEALANAIDATCEKLNDAWMETCLPEELSFFFSAVDIESGEESPQIEICFSVKDRNDETPESGEPSFVNYGFDSNKQLELAMFFDSFLNKVV